MVTRIYPQILLFAFGVLSSCGSSNRPSESAADGSEERTVIDTLLHGYSVKVSSDARKLKRGVPNELSIDVDTALGDGWYVFTKAREATIRIDTVSGNWHVVPTASTDSVSIFFSFTGRDGIKLDPARVVLLAN